MLVCLAAPTVMSGDAEASGRIDVVDALDPTHPAYSDTDVVQDRDAVLDFMYRISPSAYRPLVGDARALTWQETYESLPEVPANWAFFGQMVSVAESVLAVGTLATQGREVSLTAGSDERGWAGVQHGSGTDARFVRVIVPTRGPSTGRSAYIKNPQRLRFVPAGNSVCLAAGLDAMPPGGGWTLLYGTVCHLVDNGADSYMCLMDPVPSGYVKVEGEPVQCAPYPYPPPEDLVWGHRLSYYTPAEQVFVRSPIRRADPAFEANVTLAASSSGSRTTLRGRLRAALIEPRHSLVRRWLNHMLGFSEQDPTSRYDSTLLGPKLRNRSDVGDPVNATTGNVYEAVDDLVVPGRGLPLQFGRFYNSLSSAERARADWRHSYEARLDEAPDGTVELYEPTGAIFSFAPGAGGTYVSPVGVRDTLAETAGGFTLRRANGVRWLFLADGRLDRVIDLNGNEIVMQWDANERLTGIEGTTGRTLELTYGDSSHPSRLTAVEDWTGRTVTYAYGPHGLETVNGPAGTTRYEYDAVGRLTDVFEPGSHALPGRHRSYAYDSAGRASWTQADAGTDRIEFEYEPLAARSTVEDSKGNESVFRYDVRGQVTRITDPDGHDTQMVWDALGNNTAVIDQAGQRTDMSYDAAGNVTKIERPTTSLGRPTTLFEYGSFGRVTKITDPRGAETEYGYDADWNLVSETDPLERVTVYEYDAYGLPTKVTQTGGAETTSTYDANGYLESVTDPRSKTTMFDHDALGRLVERTDARGHATQFVYDSADRLVQRTDPPASSGAVAGETTYAYDARGDLASVTNAEGDTTLYEHDRHHRLTAVEDPTGRRVTHAYDTEGNRTSTTSPWGAATTFEYDEQRRLVKQTAPDGSTAGAITRFAYGPTGLLTKVTDPKDHETDYAYDVLGRLTKVTDAADNETSYAYNQRDELTSTTDPIGVVTRYDYDLAGQLSTKKLDRAQPAADPTWTWTYTSAGLVDTQTDPDARVTDYSYDATGNVTSVDHFGTSADATFSYDDAGNVIEATNPLGTSELGYDALDRLAEEQLPGSRTIERAYDRVGNLTGLTLPGGDTRTFAYDAASRPTTVTTSTGAYGYQYDTGGRLEQLTYPRAGERTEYADDPLGRVTGVENWRGTGQLIDELTYSYDKASNITAIDAANGDDATFGYDALNRLVDETHSTGTPLAQSFSYDGAGNRTATTRDGQTTDYDYDDLGRLTQAGATAYTYNGTGELLTATNGGHTTTYSWAPSGQVASVDLPGAGTDLSYGYDPFERRARITRGAATEDRIFVGDQVAQSTTAGTTRRYVRDASDRLLATTESGIERSYHLDALGNVRALVDPAGIVTDTLDYAAFGEPRSTPATAQPYGFLSEEYDATTGLHDFHARAYDSTIGRFTSRDPLAGVLTQPRTINPYQYSYDNPLSYRDANGRFAIEIGPIKFAWGPRPSGDSVAEGIHDATKQAVVDIANTTLDEGGALVCGACHYLLTHQGSTNFNWLAFAAAGVGDAPLSKPIKLARGVGRMTPDQQALKELIDETTHGGRNALPIDDAETILDWAEETRYPGVRAGAGDLQTPSNWTANPVPHIHVPGAGRGGHVPVKSGVRPR